jgi:hypothetical protein
VAKRWVKEATENSHGQFRAKAEAAGMSTAAFARKHDSDSGKTGAQARLAENLMALPHKHKSRGDRMRAIYARSK